MHKTARHKLLRQLKGKTRKLKLTLIVNPHPLPQRTRGRKRPPRLRLIEHPAEWETYYEIL